MATARTDAIAMLVVGAGLAGCMPEPNAGGHTSDFGGGVRLTCTTSTVEIDEAQARALDSRAVDSALALFGEDFDASYDYGDVDCEGPGPWEAGTVTIRAELERFLLKEQRPAGGGVTLEMCPDHLAVRAQTTITTDDDVVSGRITSEWDARAVPDGFETSAHVPLDQLDGSIGVRVDLARDHRAYADVKVMLRPRTTTGSLSFAVEYASEREPQAELGDGIFWPAIQLDPHCDWLAPSSDTELISLREHNAR